jgi:tetratricopeptide (TPR) repeat protein
VRPSSCANRRSSFANKNKNLCASALFRKGLALCPDDDVAHYELGKLLLASGKQNEARSEFEAALKINPNFGAARTALEGLPSNK